MKLNEKREMKLSEKREMKLSEKFEMELSLPAISIIRTSGKWKALYLRDEYQVGRM